MGRFKSLFKGIKGKLLLSAIVPVLGFVIATFIAYSGFKGLGSLLSNAYLVMVPNNQSLGNMLAERNALAYYIWATKGLNENPEARADQLEKARKSFAAFDKEIESFIAAQKHPSVAEAFQPVAAKRERFKELTKSILDELAKNSPEADKALTAQLHGGEWHILVTDLRKALQASEEAYDILATEKLVEQDEVARASTRNLIIAGAVASVLTLVFLGWIAFSISNLVGRIASRLNDAGGQVSSAIGQLSSAGQGLSQSSSAAAASLEETVASLEEMTSMVKMNSDNAKQAASLSLSSREAAEQGEVEIRSLVDQMSQISSASKKIVEIINVIDDIAFQTNLLALNAAVEAARAGEQGKGFAVVADAVRTLAQRSAAAAKDIASLIKDSVEKIDKGAKIADRSGEVMGNIVTSVKKVNDIANEIAAASGEQATGIQQVSKAMNQLDQGAQQNAASSEEIASTAEEISSQAQNMQKMVEELNAVVLGLDSMSKEIENRVSKYSAAEPVAKSESPKAKSEIKKGLGKVLSFDRKTEKAPAQAKANVEPVKEKAPKVTAPPVSQATPASKKNSAADVIPFDDEDGRGKIGDTSGF